MCGGAIAHPLPWSVNGHLGEKCKHPLLVIIIIIIITIICKYEKPNISNYAFQLLVACDQMVKVIHENMKATLKHIGGGLNA